MMVIIFGVSMYFVRYFQWYILAIIGKVNCVVYTYLRLESLLL